MRASMRQARLHFHGKNIHPGTAEGKMINAVQLLKDFLTASPRIMPEKTDGRQGFYPSASEARDRGLVRPIIRDHDRRC